MFRPQAFHRDRHAQRQRLIRRTQRVNGRVAQSSGAKVVEPTPVVRQIKAVVAAVIGAGVSIRNMILVPTAGSVGTHRSTTEPEVPIQARWDGFLFRNRLYPLRPVRRAGVRMYLGYIANLARPNDFASCPMPLV